MPDPGPRVLPRPRPLGGRRPGPLGSLGRALPGRRRGDQPAQGTTGTASPGWTPAPANACPCCPSWSSAIDQAAQGRRRAPAQRPAAQRPGQAVHRRRADPGPPGRPPRLTAKIWAGDPATGRRRDLIQEEDHAFWAWATVEVLRATGIRIEELTRADPPQPGPVPAARHRGTGPAAADRPVQDRRRTAPAGQPRTRRRAQRRSSAAIRGSSGAQCRWSPPTTPTNAAGRRAAPLLFQHRVSGENRAIDGHALRHRCSPMPSPAPA